MKYIDTDKLIAEIEKILSMADKEEKQAFLKKDGNRHLAAVTKTAICTKIKKLIASLQQEERPEVDLNKETIIDYVHNHYHYDKDFDGYGHSNLRPVFTREDLTELACHFYELGLNTRKK